MGTIGVLLQCPNVSEIMFWTFGDAAITGIQVLFRRFVHRYA